MILLDGSILIDIKKLFGITAENEDFDMDLIFHINASLSILNQLGIGSEETFHIESKYDSWSDFLGEDLDNFQEVKMYLYYKTKLGFDPTTSATMTSQLNDAIKELEWRMRVKVEMKEQERNEKDDVLPKSKRSHPSRHSRNEMGY